MVIQCSISSLAFQDRVQAELDSVVGQSRPPVLSDRDSLPLVNAVLQESLRLTSLAVDAVPHAVREEVTIKGYTFPKVREKEYCILQVRVFVIICFQKSIAVENSCI